MTSSSTAAPSTIRAMRVSWRPRSLSTRTVIPMLVATIVPPTKRDGIVAMPNPWRDTQ